MYLTNYTADRVKLAYTFAEHLRHNWRVLSDGKRDALLKEIAELTNVQFIEQQYDSRIDKIQSDGTYDKALRRAKLGL
jgi:hypothetical protein